jgi:hypothetical protein
MRLRFIIVLTALLVAGSAFADDQQLVMLNKHDFLAMKAKVSKDFEKGDRYREILPQDQEKVTKALERMDARWQKAEDASQLSPNDRIEMVNDEQLVDTILQHAAVDSRMVCHREDPIGSHMPKNICTTVAQQKREQEKAQSSMRDGKTGTN